MSFLNLMKNFAKKEESSQINDTNDKQFKKISVASPNLAKRFLYSQSQQQIEEIQSGELKLDDLISPHYEEENEIQQYNQEVEMSKSVIHRSINDLKISGHVKFTKPTSRPQSMALLNSDTNVLSDTQGSSSNKEIVNSLDFSAPIQDQQLTISKNVNTMSAQPREEANIQNNEEADSSVRFEDLIVQNVQQSITKTSQTNTSNANLQQKAVIHETIDLNDSPTLKRKPVQEIIITKGTKKIPKSETNHEIQLKMKKVNPNKPDSKIQFNQEEDQIQYITQSQPRSKIQQFEELKPIYPKQSNENQNESIQTSLLQPLHPFEDETQLSLIQNNNLKQVNGISDTQLESALFQANMVENLINYPKINYDTDPFKPVQNINNIEDTSNLDLKQAGAENIFNSKMFRFDIPFENTQQKKTNTLERKENKEVKNTHKDANKDEFNFKQKRRSESAPQAEIYKKQPPQLQIMSQIKVIMRQFKTNVLNAEYEFFFSKYKVQTLASKHQQEFAEQSAGFYKVLIIRNYISIKQLKEHQQGIFAILWNDVNNYMAPDDIISILNEYKLNSENKIFRDQVCTYIKVIQKYENIQDLIGILLENIERITNIETNSKIEIQQKQKEKMKPTPNFYEEEQPILSAQPPEIYRPNQNNAKNLKQMYPSNQHKNIHIFEEQQTLNRNKKNQNRSVSNTEAFAHEVLDLEALAASEIPIPTHSFQKTQNSSQIKNAISEEINLDEFAPETEAQRLQSQQNRKILIQKAKKFQKMIAPDSLYYDAGDRRKVQFNQQISGISYEFDKEERRFYVEDDPGYNGEDIE
ncbi:Hypothetical_protein [Hexamita inflata]|uniref:Hypothetical_protein n=1 Tax=Hexamita inflata TaxID=28002 RepID=A0AA86U355_9EUKA|nr:Hypothetical protein HINF_LOCUS16968 [Hexamita inflata]